MSTLLWFRQDLRLSDNPALAAALKAGEPIVPVYLHTPAEEARWQPGGASRWWLHQSLARLGAELKAAGSRLVLRTGARALDELEALAKECGATRVLWNRRYEPRVIARDQRLKSTLQAAGYECASYNGALLHEPWEIRNKAGGPYQVFTPYWRHCLNLEDPPEPTPAPKQVPAPRRWPASAELDALKLLPQAPEPDWAGGLRAAWTPGSAGARAALKVFLKDAYEDYGNGRDRPAVPGTSQLSPHLHFGEISPREIWHGLRRFAQGQGQHTTWRTSQYLTEIGWREFAHHLLYHYPQTPEEPLREQFKRFPWKADAAGLAAWQHGRTGYPIVDAGMRQLWHTGWMHNRVRMIVGSFLVKDLLQSWNAGAEWFWDTLVDADLASNTLGWQWVAGCGADAAPYFRIFNPTRQATRFDPDGTYVRQWVPELSRLPSRFVHEPWEAPAAVLREAGVVLGETYPAPLVEHKLARNAALAALASLTK
jgi:deoxyribodipyrimidine photo-lyase